MKVILGKKLQMTQRFNAQGVVPVTVIQAGPCTVTQVRGEKEGYRAIQIAFGPSKRISKPLAGHLKSLGNFRYLREFRMESNAVRGQTFTVSIFKPGDKVKVTGLAKGKGFQGVVKRHHFSGSPKTHGNKDQLRMPGSIGPTEPKHVFKGTRMAGRMGGQRVTVKYLEVVAVDEAKHLLYVKGAVPGGRNSLLAISGEGEMVFAQPAQGNDATVQMTAVQDKAGASEPASHVQASAPAETVTNTTEK